MYSKTVSAAYFHITSTLRNLSHSTILSYTAYTIYKWSVITYELINDHPVTEFESPIPYISNTITADTNSIC